MMDLVEGSVSQWREHPRCKALRAQGSDRSDRLDSLYEAIEALTVDQVHARLHVRNGASARVMLAGIVAAHALHRRLVAADDEHAEIVGEALRGLWLDDLSRRLDAQRYLPDAASGYQAQARRALATLLRRSPGDGQAVAAAGQLARHVIRDGAPGLRHAWYAVHGEYLLAVRPVERIAAIELMRTGGRGVKAGLHRLSGISRVTLDDWERGGPEAADG